MENSRKQPRTGALTAIVVWMCASIVLDYIRRGEANLFKAVVGASTCACVTYAVLKSRKSGRNREEATQSETPESEDSLASTNPEVSIQEEPKGLWVPFVPLVVLLASILIAIFCSTTLPRYQAQTWEEELWVTTDSWEEQSLVSKLLRAENSHADAALAEYASKLENVVFASEHRVVLFFDEETGQPYSTDRWSGNNMSPNITAKFVRPEIVENLPMAVTIAVTNEVNDSKWLFIFTYKHMGHVCELSDEEVESWKSDGFWNRYVETHGHPIAKKRKRDWNDAEEQSYQDWKKSMEGQFGGPASRVPQSR